MRFGRWWIDAGDGGPTRRRTRINRRRLQAAHVVLRSIDKERTVKTNANSHKTRNKNTGDRQ